MDETLTVAATRDGRRCVLTIAGDLDLTTAAKLFPAVTEVAGALNGQDGQTDQLVLDLAGLAFVDVAGARALMAAVHAVPGGHQVTVRSISPIARRLLDLLGWSPGTSHHAGHFSPDLTAEPGRPDILTCAEPDHD
jgi:anti-anti-sigma factor